MAEHEEQSDTPQQDDRRGRGKLIARVVVYSVLAILLVVGVLDYRVKSAVEKTATAWREAQRSTPEHDEFRQSQLEQYIKGNPKTETRDRDAKDGPLVASVVRYSWSGIVRKYEIDVGLGLGKDPAVETITAR